MNEIKMMLPQTKIKPADHTVEETA